MSDTGKSPYQWVMFLMGHGARTVNYQGNLASLLQEALPEIARNPSLFQVPPGNWDPFQEPAPAPDPVRKEIAQAFRILAEEAGRRNDMDTRGCEAQTLDMINSIAASVVERLEEQ